LLPERTYPRLREPRLYCAMSTIFHFFGLRENPFKINPDPRFLYVTDQARATSDELAYAIRTRKGLILLTGEVGTGKTMLIRRLLDWLAEQKMPTALIFNSRIKPDHLLDFILNDFGVQCASTLKSEKLMALNRWLLERYRAGQTPVLIVDEAQGLDTAALEEVRLLLNFETPREKLLQIVLAGQPELEIKLKSHDLRQLRQRITIRCRTAPLTLEQTHGYIHERLRVAGADSRNPIFEPDAVRSIYAFSRGIPRVINVLSEHSLINACAEGASTVSANAVEQAARECQLDRADSVARILNTGSYSTTSLTDIGSILAAISAGTDSAAKPLPQAQPAEASPAIPMKTSYPQQRAHASASAELLNMVSGTKNPPAQNPGAQNPSDSNAAVVAAHYVEQLPPSQPLSVQPQVGAVRTTPTAPSGHSLLHFLRLCGGSFVSDARATYRQLGRAVRSLEVHQLRPFARHLVRELHQLRTAAISLASDPRWKQLQTRAASTSEASWRKFKSAMPPWLGKSLGIRQRQANKRTQSAGSSRASRQRAVLYLRRWLHEPLNTQRKRSAARRSAN
jgi:general secretion pathway protein A